MKTILAFMLLVSLLVPQIARAQSATESAVLSASPSSEVAYDLAYPGILPDNPLYFLKAFRDRTVSILITDPMKKIEFMILTSDKRLFAGLMLFDKEKYDLGIDTISKSNNYMHEAIVELDKFRRTNKEQAASLRGKIHTSLRKHTQLTDQQLRSIPRQYQSRLTSEVNRLKEFKKTVEKMK